MTDTPIPSPPNRADVVKAFIGDIARPYAIIAIATATAWAIFDGKDAAIITAAGLILGALYTAKAIENGFGSRDAAKVETARVNAGANS